MYQPQTQPRPALPPPALNKGPGNQMANMTARTDAAMATLISK